MNKEQYERAIAALLSAMEELGKAATPAHCEAMAKVAEALAEIRKLNVRERTDIRSSGTTNNGSGSAKERED